MALRVRDGSVSSLGCNDLTFSGQISIQIIGKFGLVWFDTCLINSMFRP